MGIDFVARRIGRWGRYGEQPVIGAHPTRSDGDWVRCDLLDLEGVESGAGADDVHDRVNRADLMEVHVLDRLTVGFCLGGGEGGKDVQRRVADRWRQSRFLEEAANSAPVSRWLLGRGLDDNPRAANCAAGGRPRCDIDILDTELRDGVPERCKGNACID
jgi:hypothetical protein